MILTIYIINIFIYKTKFHHTYIFLIIFYQYDDLLFNKKDNIFIDGYSFTSSNSKPIFVPTPHPNNIL